MDDSEIREQERWDRKMAREKTERERVAELERDAVRYRRLQIFGGAPFGSAHLDNGTVLRFTNLDEFVDSDLRLHPSRGEAESASPAVRADGL